MGFFKKAIKSIIKSVINVSRPVFTFDNNQLKFKIDSDTFFIYDIENFETKTRHDSYVLDAYTLKTNELFIESVQVDNDVSWNALPISLFITHLKEKLSIKTMDLLEKKEYDAYDFMTYKIDGHFILNIIYIYEVNKDVFILDISSELYTKLLENFDSEYTYSFEKNENDSFDIDISIVKDNAFHSHFSMDN